MRTVLGAGDLQPHAQGGILVADVDGVPALRDEELLIFWASTRVKRGTGTQHGEGEVQHEGVRHGWSFLRPERLFEKFRPPRADAPSAASWRGKSWPHCSWATVHSLCSSGVT